MSAFGRWERRYDSPVFPYRPDTEDGPSVEAPSRQFLLVGNRRIQPFICGDGTLRLETRHGTVEGKSELAWGPV